jgi:DNA-binding NtrC family response regulator
MPLKIFYLDDEPALLEMFSDIFSSDNRVITTFSDPKTAIEAIRKTPPDILFIDYRLPTYTGDQIAQMLDPNIPKVLITGDMHIKCSYNFIAIFKKPYKASQIEEILEKLAKNAKEA